MNKNRKFNIILYIDHIFTCVFLCVVNSKCSNVKSGQKLCVKANTNAKNGSKKTTGKKKTTLKKKITTKKKATIKKKTTTKKNTATKKTTKKRTSTTTFAHTTTTTADPTNTATTTKTAYAATATYTYNYGLTAQISGPDDFCIFLPKSPGNKEENNGQVDIDAIADSEKSAAAFCTKPNANAPGARTLPVDFITTAHFYTDDEAGYTQVTGQFNRASWELSEKDEGGQYDNHGRGSPPLSMCHGYRYYVNMIEPNTQIYCMRW